MKIKAVIHPKSPKGFIVYLNEEIAKIILQRVLVPCMHVGSNFGPAEFYVQECDIARGGTPGFLCEVRLTGVSFNRKRSINDFYEAAKELHKIYAEAIKKFFQQSDRVQLFVCIMVDKPLPETNENLIETEPEWVNGGL